MTKGDLLEQIKHILYDEEIVFHDLSFVTQIMFHSVGFKDGKHTIFLTSDEDDLTTNEDENEEDE